MVQSSVASLTCDHHFDNANSNVRPPCYIYRKAGKTKQNIHVLFKDVQRPKQCFKGSKLAAWTTTKKS